MASRKPASSTHRVLFLITSSGTGGAENLFKELILRLDRSRFEPLFCSLRPAGATATVIELAGVPVFSLEMSERPSAVEMIRGWGQLRSIYRKHSIDMVQASLYRANVLAPMSVQMGQDMPRIVTSQHSLAPLSGRLPSLMTRRAHRLSDRVVAVSGAVRRYMIESERIPSEQIVVIPNGVDTQRFRLSDARATRESLGLSVGELVIGAAGRLTPVKGFDTLIEAVKRLHLSGTRPRLLIAGEGPERKALAGAHRWGWARRSNSALGTSRRPGSPLFRFRRLRAVVPQGGLTKRGSRSHGFPVPSGGHHGWRRTGDHRGWPVRNSGSSWQSSGPGTAFG